MDNKGAAGWAHSLDLLRDSFDPEWSEAYSDLTVNPWLSSALQAKEYQLIAVGLSAAIGNLDGPALRRHIWLALRAGATQAEDPRSSEDGCRVGNTFDERRSADSHRGGCRRRSALR